MVDPCERFVSRLSALWSTTSFFCRSFVRVNGGMVFDIFREFLAAGVLRTSPHQTCKKDGHENGEILRAYSAIVSDIQGVR